jgi:proline iminopeptidase
VLSEHSTYRCAAVDVHPDTQTTVQMKILITLLFLSLSLSVLNLEEGWKHINGVRLYYKTNGSGEPILIVHGGPGLDHSYFLPQMEPLGRTSRLIFFDQRAHGKSDIPQDSTAMGILNFVNDIEELREEFGLGRMNLLGHSWGGLVAMWYAVTYPQNLKSLILVNSAGPRSEDRFVASTELARRVTRQDSLDRASVLQSEDFRARDAAAFARLFRISFRPTMFNRSVADSLTLEFPADYAVKNRMLQYMRKDLERYDLTDKLRMISVPTLIVHGEHDAIPAVIPQSIRSHIHRSTLVTLERCGHFPFLEQPAAFFKAIQDFLRSIQ